MVISCISKQIHFPLQNILVSKMSWFQKAIYIKAESKTILQRTSSKQYSNCDERYIALQAGTQLTIEIGHSRKP